MNSKIGASFGLAMLMAAGALATMYALGTVLAKDVRADHVTPGAAHLVSMTPSSLDVNAKSALTVTLGVSGAGLSAGSGTVSVTFPDGVLIPPLEKTGIAIGSDVAGNGVFALFPLTSDPTIHGQTVSLTIPAAKPGGGAITGNDRFLANDQIQVLFNQQAGLVNPARSGSAGSISAGTAGKVSTSVQTSGGNISKALSFIRTISLGGRTTQAEGGAVTVTVGGFDPGLTVSLSGAVSGFSILGDDGQAVISGTMLGADDTVTATDTSGGAATSGIISVSPSLSVTGTPQEPKPTVTPSEAEVGAVRDAQAPETTAPETLFADVISNNGNLVRVWRFDNPTQVWSFYDPRPEFEAVNTLATSGAGDIVWLNVTAEQAFQGGTLFPGWNVVSLD